MELRQNVIWCVLLAVLALNAGATPPPMSVSFEGKTYQLTLSHGKLQTRQNGKDVIGNLQNRMGDFSHWRFQLEPSGTVGFEVIINEKTSKILNQKNDLDAGGPFLEAASPDSKLVVFDYGTGPTERDLEMRDSNGKVLLKDTYIGQVKWTGNAFEYGIPKDTLPTDSNKETKACADAGYALKVEPYSFDGKTKRKLNKPATIECSN